MAGAVSAAAQPAEEGLDLVMLVDRSTSMALQQEKLRLLLRLGFDVLARNGDSTRATHRIAVLSFGASVTTDLPLTRVDAADRARQQRIIERLPSRDLGDTDVFRALVAAESLLRVQRTSSARRRAIVLVTDGVPYVRDADMTTYRREARRFVATHLSQPFTSLDVLLLTSSVSDSRWWRDLAPGRVHAASRADSLLAEGAAVVACMAGTRMVESMPAKANDAIETIVIPPYLDVVVFDVFRESANATVLLFPPGAQEPLREGDRDVEMIPVGDVLSTVIVHRPGPGEWIVRRSEANAGARVMSEQFFPRGMLIQPGVSETLHQFDRTRVTYRVVDADGQPIVELPAHKLTLGVMITRPDGSIESLPMDARPALGASVFAGVAKTDCNLAGRYWTDVKIATIDSRGQPVEVFRDRWSGFSVRAAERGERPVDATAAERGVRRGIVSWCAPLAVVIVSASSAIVLIRRDRPRRTRPM